MSSVLTMTMTKKEFFALVREAVAEALVGNMSSSVTVWEEVGMPEHTQEKDAFVDKAESKGHTSYTPYVPEDHPIEFPPGIKDLEHWGRALVTTGVHKGARYHSLVGDGKYMNFLIGARDKLNPPARDLANYFAVYLHSSLK